MVWLQLSWSYLSAAAAAVNYHIVRRYVECNYIRFSVLTRQNNSRFPLLFSTIVRFEARRKLPVRLTFEHRQLGDLGTTKCSRSSRTTRGHGAGTSWAWSTSDDEQSAARGMTTLVNPASTHETASMRPRLAANEPSDRCAPRQRDAKSAAIPTDPAVERARYGGQRPISRELSITFA